MNTLPLRSSHIPEAWVLPAFGRFGAFMSSLIDVFADAQSMAVAAQKRYPFASGW
jgi:hypothetical protein